MDSNRWSSGKLLIHIHKKWDLQTPSQLDCLSSGADGVWASLCEEGAAMGHACSSVTLMNLIRLGNTKVLEKHNCTHLRNAAKTITKITTGEKIHIPSKLCTEDRLWIFLFLVGWVLGTLT